MNTEALLTTIDLGPLLDMRARFAGQFAGIVEQLNADDAQAAEVAERMLDDETAAIETVVEQFRKFCNELDYPHLDDFRQGLDGLCVTGDLGWALDEYRRRRQRDAALTHVDRFAEALRSDPVFCGTSDVMPLLIEQVVRDAVTKLWEPVDPAGGAS
jgi:hypothetical protein